MANSVSVFQLGFRSGRVSIHQKHFILKMGQLSVKMLWGKLCFTVDFKIQTTVIPKLQIIVSIVQVDTGKQAHNINAKEKYNSKY